MLNRNNIEYEIDQITNDVDINDYVIMFGVKSIGLDSLSKICIKINNQLVHEGSLQDGQHCFKNKLHVKPNNSIKFLASTKTHKHPQQVIINQLIINNVDILKSHLWVFDSQRFIHHDGTIQEQVNGIYHNGVWNLTIPTPLFPWLRQRSNQFTKNIYKDQFRLEDENKDYYSILDKVFR